MSCSGGLFVATALDGTPGNSRSQNKNIIIYYVILKKCNVRPTTEPRQQLNVFLRTENCIKTLAGCILTRVREYGLVVSVVEDVVPVAQREFFQIRDFGLVDDVLRTDEVNMYLLSTLSNNRPRKTGKNRWTSLKCPKA